MSLYLNFRSISPEDYSTCSEILVAAYSGAPWFNQWTKQEALLRIQATMSGTNARGYIVENDKQIIAMCLGRIDYYYDNWKQFCIDEFNVAPHVQKQGVGKKLMEFVADILEEEGISNLFLITGEKQAVEFYKKSGFVKSDDGTMMECVIKNGS